jgi:predicted dehydrogenase
MARTSAEGKKMIAAAKKARKKLFVAQCIRYWPQYDKAREIVKSKKYGKVLSATFTRLSLTPTWSWQNWLMDKKKSGNCALDLHIHDADFIRHCFGEPKSVVSSGSGFKKGQLDHVTTVYDYGNNSTIVAEGGWDLPAGFGFTMAFNIVMEKATLQCSTPDLDLNLHPLKGKSKVLKVAAGDGYLNELKDFVAAIAKNGKAKLVTPESALKSVSLIEAEEKSALTGKPVKLK